jgi:hypothetical protein
MQLDLGSRRLLGQARIGMLALNSGRLPVVNPAAFTYQGGSIWMTTSRYAAKVGMARLDPRAAFLVAAGGRSLLLQGVLEAFDLRTAGGSLRAALQGPAFALGMAGYAVKNAAFIAGYLVDLAAIPRQWWPHNRVVLRLRPARARVVEVEPLEHADRARLPAAPAEVTRPLEREPEGHLAWIAPGGGGIQMAPALWAVSGGEVVAWLPAGLPPPAPDAGAALVVEFHHPYRATRMIGACVRGRVLREAVTPARLAIADRYGADLEGGHALRLAAQRVTWWRGFQVRTDRIVAPAPQA